MTKTKSVQVTVPKAVGHPPKFETPQQLLEYFTGYMTFCEEAKRLPNIAGFVVWCYKAKGLMYNRDTYYATIQREGYSDIGKMIDIALEDSTLNNDTQSNLIRLAYLNNKCGYINTSRTESKNITLNVNAEVDSEERSKLIADLLIKRDSISYPQIGEDIG